MCNSKAEGGQRCAGLHSPAECNASRRACRAAEQFGVVALVNGDGVPAGNTHPALSMPGTPTVSTEPRIEPMTAADRVAAMKDLRREIVGDDAAPDAGAEWAAMLTRQRVEAAAAGCSTDHLWSSKNRTWLALQARGRFARGWFAGNRQWAEQDREVLEGAQPFQIFRPTAFTREEKDVETGEVTKVRGGAGFTAVAVYDWSQTRRRDGQPDPTWSVEIPGGSEALYEQMVASSPIPVNEVTDGSTGTAHGWTDGRVVTVDARRPVGDRIHTLAHEFAHVQLDHVNRQDAGELTYENGELEAELTAYLVVRSLNLGEDTDSQVAENSGAYLKSWAKADGTSPAGHKARWEIFEAKADVAAVAASAIVTRLLGIEQPAAKTPTMIHPTRKAA